MKRLWLINQFANTPDMPGHTRQYDIGKGLRGYGWKINIISSDYNLSERKFKKLKSFQLQKKEIIDNCIWLWLRVIPYKKNNWKRILNMISFCIHLVIYLVPIFLYHKIFSNCENIIYVSSPQLPAAYVSLLIAKAFKVPFILEIRDLWPQVLIEQGNKKKDSKIVKLFLWIEKELYKNANKIIILSKGSEIHIKNKGGKNIFWLPNGPDLKKVRFQELPKENKRFDKNRPFRILYSGAHGDANDLINIINAAKILKNEPIVFYLYGDGTEKKKLIKISSNLNNIFFYNPVPKSEIFSKIKKCDAMIISLKDVPVFKYGVSPNKLYDAYAIGRPVISTVKGLVNEEITKYRLGVTADPNNPKSLAKIIKDLSLLPRKDREKMGIRARKLAENLYDRNKIIDNLNAILENI